MKTETRVGIFVIGAIGVFIYLSFNMGAFRMDQTNYDTYIAFFEDTGGLEVDSPIKASGVKIGRVSAINLRPNGKAEVHLKILKVYKLALNAYPTIQQGDLLGAKTMELDQGDFATGVLPPGSTLSMPGRTSASIPELVDQFRDIAVNVGDIASVFKETFASAEGKAKLASTLDDASDAAKNISRVAQRVENIVEEKRTVITTAIDDIGSTAAALREAAPELKQSIFPALEKIGPAAQEAEKSFTQITEVMEKVNNGTGMVGKFVNEPETYNDLKKTIRGVKSYVDRLQSLQIYIDMHSETLLKNTEGKGYFELKIRPQSDYFYLLQLVSDEFGSLKRTVYDYKRYTESGERIYTSDLTLPRDRVEFPDHLEVTERIRNMYHVGIQFGKRFDRFTLRVGLFEGAVGGAIDFYVPLKLDWFHWITTVEAFDFRGVKRLDDTRPHVKWSNKLFFMRNLYTCFGIDDMMSKQNSRPFFGGGLRFNDDDLKYFMSLLSGFKVA